MEKEVPQEDSDGDENEKKNEDKEKANEQDDRLEYRFPKWLSEKVSFSVDIQSRDQCRRFRISQQSLRNFLPRA